MSELCVVYLVYFMFFLRSYNMIVLGKGILINFRKIYVYRYYILVLVLVGSLFKT